MYLHIRECCMREVERGDRPRPVSLQKIIKN